MSIETRQTVAPSAAATATPRVIAVFSYRDDAHLVPAMLENIAPAIHGWAAWDDRAQSGGPGAEPARRGALLSAAREMAADWILAVDPDERFERALADRIGVLTTPRWPVLWTFALREMFAPGHYRSDGLWDGKAVLRLFPADAALAPSEAALHGSWVDPRHRAPRRPSGLELYHLRMMTPERRAHRRDTYAAADPERRFQDIGYDYLSDPCGQVLTPVPPERGFDPPHAEDGGLWAAPVTAPTPPDPLPARLRFLHRNRRPGGGVQAAGLLGDVAEEDPDLALLAAEALVRCGDLDRAGGVLDGLIARHPDMALAHVLQARRLRRAGDDPGAARAALRAADSVPESLLVQQEVQRSRPMPDRVLAPDALWRRWCPEASREGARIACGALVPGAAGIAVVVIGLHAPPALARAVGSLLAQDVAAEIVVVNTGGGDIRAVLGPHLPLVRLIDVADRLFVGAARNIGIDATTAPVVAFLADDCRPGPGWLSARLSRHADGAEAVASAVVPERPGNVVALASNAVLYSGRWPHVEPQDWTLYGLSYARHLFETFGYFPPRVRLREDTLFNQRLVGRARIDWAPEVQTAHADPTTLRGALRDVTRRARRRLTVPPHDRLPGLADAGARIAAQARNRRDAALAALGHLPGSGPVRRRLAAAMIRLLCRADARAMRRACAAIPPPPEEVTPDTLGEALRHAPRNAALWLKRAAVLLPQDEAGAEAALRTACDLLPEDHAPLDRLVDLLVRQGRTAEAARLTEAAALSVPGRRYFWYAAQRATVKTRHFVHVRLMVQAGLIADPTFATLHRLAGQVHGLLGQTDQARRRVECAQDLDATAKR